LLAFDAGRTWRDYPSAALPVISSKCEDALRAFGAQSKAPLAPYRRDLVPQIIAPVLYAHGTIALGVRERWERVGSGSIKASAAIWMRVSTDTKDRWAIV